MRALHQFVPTFEPGATGAHMLELQRLAREVLGVESELFAEHARGPHAAAVRHHTEYKGGADDVLVYHMAIGSSVSDYLVDRPEPLLVDFHNITPSHFIEPWEPAAAYGCAWGRNQLKELAVRAELGIGHSRYSEEELRAEGFADTAVAPLLLDLSSFDTEVDEALVERLRSSPGTNLLFVGRLAANKCQHDLVKVLAVYRRLYDPHARLHLVGGSSADSYVEAVRGFSDELGLADAVNLAGAVPPAELAAYYRAADVFVCVSEHEGFCVPVVEAMWNRVPVVAFAAAAVPETVGDGGLVLPTKEPATVAAAVDLARRRRDDFAAAGTKRLADFDLATTRAHWLEALGAR